MIFFTCRQRHQLVSRCWRFYTVSGYDCNAWYLYIRCELIIRFGSPLSCDLPLIFSACICSCVNAFQARFSFEMKKNICICRTVVVARNDKSFVIGHYHTYFRRDFNGIPMKSLLRSWTNTVRASQIKAAPSLLFIFSWPSTGPITQVVWIGIDWLACVLMLNAAAIVALLHSISMHTSGNYASLDRALYTGTLSQDLKRKENIRGFTEDTPQWR